VKFINGHVKKIAVTALFLARYRQCLVRYGSGHEIDGSKVPYSATNLADNLLSASNIF
jgi:hypothetical protein